MALQSVVIDYKIPLLPKLPESLGGEVLEEDELVSLKDCDWSNTGVEGRISSRWGSSAK